MRLNRLCLHWADSRGQIPMKCVRVRIHSRPLVLHRGEVAIRLAIGIDDSRQAFPALCRLAVREEEEGVFGRL